MTTYMLVIHGDHREWAMAGPEEQRRLGDGHRKFAEAAGDAMLAGHEVAPAADAVTVSSTSGALPEVTTGPFQGSTVVVGGYYLIDVVDIAEAIRLASLLPEASAGHPSGVEIRQVIEPA